MSFMEDMDIYGLFPGVYLHIWSSGREKLQYSLSYHISPGDYRSQNQRTSFQARPDFGQLDIRMEKQQPTTLPKRNGLLFCSFIIIKEHFPRKQQIEFIRFSDSKKQKADSADVG